MRQVELDGTHGLLLHLPISDLELQPPGVELQYPFGTKCLGMVQDEHSHVYIRKHLKGSTHKPSKRDRHTCTHLEDLRVGQFGKEQPRCIWYILESI